MANCNSSEYLLRELFNCQQISMGAALDEEDKALWLLECKLTQHRSRCKPLVEHCRLDDLLEQIMQRRTQISAEFDEISEPWMD
jgi:hypothetical protein